MNETVGDVVQNLHAFLKAPTVWTPRSINAVIDKCAVVGVDFWGIALDKIGQFGTTNLIGILRSANEKR